MKKLALAAAVAAIAAVTSTVVSAAFAQQQPQQPQQPQQAQQPPQQAAPGAEPAAPAGLSDLEKTTFACPRAALNAAGREVATYKSQGTYQFAYFNIVSASHHAAYEVHFKSNATADPVLKFCVSLYCQQGFDPATTKTSVALMDTKPGTKTAGHAAGGHAANACIPPRTPTKRPATR